MVNYGKISLAMSLFCAACNPPVAERKPQKLLAADPVKILAFYPRDAVIIPGGTTLLCYGVSNAKSVHVDPPVDGISPALTRCVEIHPKGETKYTLTAEGSGGQTVSQSTVVHVGGDVAGSPKISAFKIDGKQKDYAGKTMYTLTFAAQNADEISISPPVFHTVHGAPSGTFSVTPDKTTTYTLSAKGKNGQVIQKQLTLEVLGS